MSTIIHWSFVLVLFISPLTVQAANKTLFEAYYKVKNSGQHVGYYIQRYELDPKKKQFISTSFLRTNSNGGNISESLIARATDTLKPIDYKYTSLQGKEAKTIDVNVRKDKKGQSVMQVKVVENGKLRVFEKSLAKGSFFSTFLVYLLLQGEKGLTPGAKYNFRAIAEEDGKAFPGEVYIESETSKMNLPAYKVLYTFKRTQFVNFIASKGESLHSISPALGIEAEIVNDPQEATQNMPYNKKSLTILFGGIPKGNHHPLSAVKTLPKKTTNKSKTVKKSVKTEDKNSTN